MYERAYCERIPDEPATTGGSQRKAGHHRPAFLGLSLPYLAVLLIERHMIACIAYPSDAINTHEKMYSLLIREFLLRYGIYSCSPSVSRIFSIFFR
jgi:hypothetical protein